MWWALSGNAWPRSADLQALVGMARAGLHAARRPMTMAGQARKKSRWLSSHAPAIQLDGPVEIDYLSSADGTEL